MPAIWNRGKALPFVTKITFLLVSDWKKKYCGILLEEKKQRMWLNASRRLISTPSRHPVLAESAGRLNRLKIASWNVHLLGSVNPVQTVVDDLVIPSVETLEQKFWGDQIVLLLSSLLAKDGTRKRYTGKSEQGRRGRPPVRSSWMESWEEVSEQRWKGTRMCSVWWCYNSLDVSINQNVLKT